MQSSNPPPGKPMTIRGADGKPHLVSDLDPISRPATRPRIRPIVPNIFRTPD
ncbi:hypothetical protein SAMN06295905_1444 [Devosia lucknowensis]|uniref:Uncharacterized protein n=1 Tax=Devosia lucknowensis TaxID=1096929 RepID=A0A1Y6EU98_9HYPH|nr:hypothetical protein [Devosia lucknowensis]SMQ66294.1 hypothetical protein SAMN06295905_1444 [Devosia lucknowensis]